MGVSLPGRVDRTGRLVFAPNLGWASVNIQELLEAAVKLPVVAENAANACALAELWFGQHPEHLRHLIAVTVSEGIGVGLLVNGQLVHGGDSLAGEFGHVTLDETGPPCPCGKTGCWERYASNAAALRFYESEGQHNGGRRPAPPSLRFDGLLRLAESGDRRAGKALERMAGYLGSFLAGLATGLAPELIVIVGDVTRAWPRIAPIIDAALERQTLPGSTTRIVPTDPAMQPRLRGAVTLVVQQHFGAPNVA
jgi:predicted NBD/HSP70 family sugar kinase